MNEPFDKTLRNHIRDTFDHFDDGMADDGWKKFNHQKNKKKRGLIFWYSLPSGIAAALALIWLLNLNAFNTIDGAQNPVIANNKAVKAQINPTKIPEITAVSNSNSNQENAIVANRPKIVVSKQLKSSFQKDQISIPKKINISEPNQAFVATKEVQKQLIINENPVQSNVVTSNIVNQQTLAQNQENNTQSETTINNEVKPELTVKEKSILLANALKTIPENNSISAKQNPASNNKKFNIAIDANTYYSFTDAGVNNQLNLGLGLAAELKIAKNLSLNSGISFNRQTTSFEGNEKIVSSLSTTDKAFAAVPNSQFSNAKLTGLDIPLNLKLDIKIGKAKTFVTSGISSYSLINEKYVNDFSITNYSFNGATIDNVTTTVENPDGKFSSFDFARTLNFSFGVVYPVSKKHTISLEPFLKYPLSGFGYQDLKIGSGGLSFKLNIGK